MIVLLSVFFTNQIHGGSSADYSLFTFLSLMLALHLAVKMLLQIFLYEDLSTLALHTSVGCVSLQNASRTALCYAIMLWVKTFPDAARHSLTKHKEVRPDWETIKTIMQTTRPRIPWKVLPMARVAIFKEIFNQVRKDLDCELFYWTKTSQRLINYI